MDKITSPVTTVNIEHRFFNEHIPTNQIVVVGKNFMQRKNQVLKFVEKTVKQIGYPYWDKAMVFSGSSNSFNRSASGDSINSVFIPFVRDSQHVVNAGLQIIMTPVDTSYKYLCDWQYSDSINTGNSGKKQSLLLMQLDKNVFGSRLYKVLDSVAFGQEPGKSARFVRIISSTLSGKPGPTHYAGKGNGYYEWVTVTICSEVHIQNSGWNYGCAPDDPNCNGWHLETQCEDYISYVYVDSDGGTGSGGSGGEPTVPDGNGDGGSGSGAPPNCNTGSGSGTNTNPCGPGWVTEEEPEANYEILNNCTNPCIYNSVNTAIDLNCKNKISNFLNGTFSNSQNFHLLFTDGAFTGTLATADAKTITAPINPSSTEIKTSIKFNITRLSGASKEYIAATILHEAIHAWIDYQYPIPVENTEQHNLMASTNRFNLMVIALMEMFPNLNQQDAIDLTWGGLYETILFNNLPSSERQRIVDTNENYRTRINGSGTPC